MTAEERQTRIADALRRADYMNWSAAEVAEKIDGTVDALLREAQTAPRWHHSPDAPPEHFCEDCDDQARALREAQAAGDERLREVLRDLGDLIESNGIPHADHSPVCHKVDAILVRSLAAAPVQPAAAPRETALDTERLALAMAQAQGVRDPEKAAPSWAGIAEKVAERYAANAPGFAPAAAPRETADRPGCPGCPHPVHDGSCPKPGRPGVDWQCNCRADIETDDEVVLPAAETAALRAAIEDLPYWHCSPCGEGPGDHGNIERAAVLRLLVPAAPTRALPWPDAPAAASAAPREALSSIRPDLSSIRPDLSSVRDE